MAVHPQCAPDAEHTLNSLGSTSWGFPRMTSNREPLARKLQQHGSCFASLIFCTSQSAGMWHTGEKLTSGPGLSGSPAGSCTCSRQPYGKV